MDGLQKTIQDITNYVDRIKNPYLTSVVIQKNRWLAGASHCKIRDLMKENKIPSIKVGVAYKAHYLDVINYLEKSYKRGNL